MCMSSFFVEHRTYIQSVQNVLNKSLIKEKKLGTVWCHFSAHSLSLSLLANETFFAFLLFFLASIHLISYWSIDWPLLFFFRINIFIRFSVLSHALFFFFLSRSFGVINGFRFFSISSLIFGSFIWFIYTSLLSHGFWWSQHFGLGLSMIV